MTLYPNKSGWISNLLEEAKQHLKVEGPLRLLELMSSKIFIIYRPDMNIDHLTNTTQKSYRIEEIPPDQRDLAEDEMLVPVAHYQKEAYSTFGHPFLIKVKEGESFDSVKERIQKFLDVSDKEFEKYRTSLVCMGRPRYLDEEQIKTVRLRDFSLQNSQSNTTSTTQDHTKHSGNQHAKPFIGLQHQNKNSKRARYNYMEKAIKIYN